MGERELLAVGRALTFALLGLAVAGAARAQGPVYRERWGYLHLEARRAEVRAELAGRDAATHEKVAALLQAPDRGVPFAPVAAALAHLRACEADAAFLLRSAIGAYVLPEVCDPDAANEICRSTNVSVFVPFAIPFPGQVTFDLQVLDAAGKEVWATRLDKGTEERDVRMALPSAQVPGAQLADGSYRLVLRTRIDGALPRPHDPEVRWTFHVLRGYQARAEQAMAKARDLDASLGATDRAWFAGLSGQVLRAYHGESFAVQSDGAADLLRLERALANVAASRPVADGIDGDVCLGLPVQGGQPLSCVLRRARATTPRPMVVFVAGTPVYDPSMNRPAAPATRDPRWLAHELAGFGGTQDWHVAFLESPGVGRDFAAALRQALPLLGQVVATGEHRPLLVCEREAAAIVGLHIADYRAMVRGVVFLGGGVMPAPAVAANGALPVRYGRLHGFAEDGLVRMLDYVALQQGQPDWRGDVAWLSPRRVAWPFAMPGFADDIAVFAAGLFP